MTEEQIKLYFERIGLEYDKNEPQGIDQLNKIQYAHITHVPYENTEIVDGHPLSLEEDDLFQKIVTERRGGYCFEQNGLLACVLRSMGYEIEEYMGRFLRGETEIPMPRHRVLAVKIQGKIILCEVGIGSDAPYHTLEIVNGKEQDGYRFVKDDLLGTVLEEYVDGKWSPFFSFTECKQINKDYIPLSYYCENHPSSIFHTNMLSLKTPDGRVTIDGNTFRIRSNGEITFEKEMTESELCEICPRYFGMTLHR